MADLIVSVEDAQADLDQIVSMVGEEHWKRKYFKLSKSWPHLDLQPYLLQHHSIEMQVGQTLNGGGGVNRIGEDQLDALQQDALIFGHLSMRLARVLPEPLRLADHIRGYLNNNQNLRPYLFEIETCNTLQLRGFSVRLTDLLDEAQHDFLATLNEESIAVECKHVSGDAGMTIHRSEALELFDRIIGYCTRRGIDLNLLHIDVRIPERLDIDRVSRLCFESLSEFQDKVSDVATVRCRRISPEVLTRLTEIQEAADHPELQHQQLNETLGIEGSNHLYIRGTRAEIRIISLSSATPSTPIPKIFKRLIDDTKRQLPDNLPGVLMVEMSDVEAGNTDFFARHEGGHPIGEHIAELFTRRPHVAGVSFVAGVRNTGSGHPWAQAGGAIHRPSLVFRNRTHPMHDNPLLLTALGPSLD